jgi:hypothetical protein
MGFRRRATRTSFKKHPDIQAMQEQNEREILCYVHDDMTMGRRFQPNLVRASTWNAIDRLKAKNELEQVDDALGGYVLTESGKSRLFTLGLRKPEPTEETS